MEAAIRWSPHSTRDNPRFLIIDVAGNRLRLCQIDSFNKSRVNYKQICIRDKLPNYTAFDWSKKDPSVVAIGSASGEATVVTLDPEKPDSDYIHSFSIRHQRKCNSIAFSSKNLLATGLDRVRNDVCLNIYDLNDSRVTAKDEPYKKLASSEAISSIKFFTGQPDTLVAGVSRQYLRIYDLRDSSTAGIAQFQTRQVHNITIDPMDENYFLSAGTTGDPTVTVWDTRFVKQRGTSADTANSGAVLDFKPIVDNSQSASIWSLRYSGTKRGTFGVLANTGEFKIIEFAQHSHQPLESADTPFARAWASPYYTKASHHLRYPFHGKQHLQDAKERIVAYDFMVTGNPLSGQCALGLHSNRDVEVFKVPPPAPRLNVSALEEIFKDRTCIAKPSSPHDTIAEDLLEVQNRVLGEKYDSDQDTRSNLTATMDKMTLNSQRSPSLLSATHPSHLMHEELLSLAYPDVKIPLSDYLAVLQASKRRVREGYSLDCAKNKAIVSNDPWLVDVWTLVDRMDAHASEDGMVGNGLDLKYLGVSSIWANELTMYDERLIDPDAKTSQEMFSDAVQEIVEVMQFPAFEGVPTEYPANRQLCLSLCGWSLDEPGVQRDCEQLVEQGEIYKAIVLAVFQGHKDIALTLLRSTLQAKKLPQDDIGLAAVIACASPSSGISPEQREACAWMADMTSDAYLKSLLTYFITGDWSSVVSQSQLSLPDRIAIALKYLPDPHLTTFLTQTTSTVIRRGDISGLLLTGLTTRFIDLCQVHISKYPAPGLQTAVLLLSRACPLYVQDERWTLWKENYCETMQTWRTFLERTRYIKQHNLLSVTRQGLTTNKPSQPSLTLRCLNCQQNLALRKDSRAPVPKHRLVPTPLFPPTPNPPSSSTARLHPHAPPPSTPGNRKFLAPAGLACPNCGAQMPRCGLCLLWLGCPDPARLGAYEVLKGEERDARLMVFCMACTHGFHAHHARDWFARHAMCPVPDCGCMCGLLR
ncbi:WD40 repeat-like protein [Decorospora gaudefroyi]|uniref:WD40 repeat-like protein n=1 Tax=Decorospora gaudefroyi TaxID=184978 RepID=A0A6A5JZI7_9PLEO|nr:WD40 repeat-like protein [Decorospora gaudefroyi]